MSDKPQPRIRRKKNASANESTARFSRKSTKTKPPETKATPKTPVFEPLDLSAFEDDAFDLSMDDVFTTVNNKRYKVGQVVTGEVCGIQGDAILVDIQAKSEAVLPVDNPADFSLGSRVEAKIIRMDGQGILLAQKIGKSADLSAYELAYSEQLPVEGTVHSSNKGGFSISFGNIKGFCPISQMTLGAVNAEDHVGQTYQFLITELKTSELIVSRRRLVERERAAKKDQRMSQLSVGMNLLGTILNITQHGAFVDLDGVDGLIPKFLFSAIGEDLSVGDEIEVQIKHIKDGKISLEAPSSNPWLKMGTEFKRGGTYEATVTKEKEFGFFAKLAPNLEGLLHRSGLSTEDIAELKIGATITVRIEDFDLERKRIGLQLAAGMPEYTNEPSSTLGDAFADVFAQFDTSHSEKSNRRKKKQK